MSDTLNTKNTVRIESLQDRIINKGRQRKARFTKPPIIAEHPGSFIADQYRLLCSRLDQLGTDESLKLFSVSSAVKGEGKTTTSLNLAYIMAKEFKKKVLLVDGDLRNPSFGNFLKVEKGPGFIDLINGVEFKLSDLCYVGEGFYCLPNGEKGRIPVELFKRSHIKSLFGHLKSFFDYIIVDSPPVMHMADMGIIAEIVDGVLFVVKAGKTTREAVVSALQSLTTGRKIGIVLNYAKSVSNKYYYYY